MNFTSYIAGRYFFSRKSGKTVNIISAVSMLGILVGTAALIIVLSAFNGLESLVKGFYEAFDPDVKATLTEGKYTSLSEEEIRGLQNIPGVEEVSLVLEERVLLTFRNKEYIATLKGVDKNFTQVSEASGELIAGDFVFWRGPDKSIPSVVLGAGVAYYLGYSRADLESPLTAYVPREKSGLDFSSAFASDLIYPSGIFSIQPEFDEKYALASIDFVRDLLARPDAVNAVEFSVSGNEEEAKEAIRDVLGARFKVQDREEQQEVFFKVMKSENLFTFLVFTLILAISTFTIMGSITMLILDKRQHIFTLWALGTPVESLRKIFFKEGMLISMVGAVTGLALGVAIILLQEHYGLLSVGEGYAVDAYPVELDIADLPVVFATVFLISAITSGLTSRRLDLKFLKKALD